MSLATDPPETQDAARAVMSPCRLACPAGIDVPRYIRHIAGGDFNGALKVIREKIPFPAVCGYACVHPCEVRCARRQYDEAVSIRLLKRAAEEMSSVQVVRSDRTPPTGKTVAIVGSGPCGLTAAYYLAILGHEVTVFEALSKPGGMLRYGIPGYRLPPVVAEREIGMIQSCGVRIRTNVRTGPAADLLSKGFDAVLVAAGAWTALKMGLAGEDAPMVIDGLRFLREINAGQRRSAGQKVAVVGGGNTAVDAARASVRLGAETILVYRRTRVEMPAAAEEIAAAEEEGVRIECMAMPGEIARGKIICLRTAPGPVDTDGRCVPVPVAGSEFALPCNTLVVAVGQRPNGEAFRLETHADGRLKVGRMQATSIAGVFAAGDVVSGPKTIIDAIAQGRMAAVAIDRHLGGEGRINPPPASDRCPALPRPAPMEAGRQASSKTPVEKRLSGFALVEAGYDSAAAVAEAKRCLACDCRRYRPEVDPALCKGCGYCMEICQLAVFSPSEHFNAAGYRPYSAQNPQHCVGCLKCVYICPDLAVSLREE